MTLSDGDFIKLHFTGKRDDGTVFDTTRESVAKEHGLSDRNVRFEPITMCIGKGFVLDGIDEALVGRSVGDAFSVTLSPEQGFGKKRSDLIKLMPLKAFNKQGVKPQPGLELNIDGMHGTIKSVTGNRVIVDFNNPLSGQDLEYDLEVVSRVDDLKEQVSAVASRLLRFSPSVSVKEKDVTITLPMELPGDLSEQLTKHITDMTSAENVDVVVEAPKTDKT